MQFPNLLFTKLKYPLSSSHLFKYFWSKRTNRWLWSI